MSLRRAARILSVPMAARLQGQAATPASLAGLVAWGEGSDLGADGTSIASWLNKTGSGLDAAQATGANQPTVKANAINGQKAALFTAASSQFLAFPAGALGWFNGVAGCTFAAVVQPVIATTTGFYLNASINGSTPSRMALLQSSAGPSYRLNARPDDVTLLTVNGTSVPTVGTSVIQVGILSGTGGTLTQYVNGALDGSTAFTAGALAATNSFEVTIGGRSISNFYTGYVAAYAMWNAAYSATQLRPVLNRWSSLYGISLA